MFYAGVLMSGFSIAVFTIDGRYLFEFAVLSAGIFFLVFRDAVGTELYRVTERAFPNIALAALFVGIFFLIGVVAGHTPADAYADFRANLVVVASFLVARLMLHRDRDALLKLALATSILSLVFWAYSGDAAEAKFAAPLLAGVSAIVIAAEDNRRTALLVAVIATTALAILSFFRQNWVLAALSLCAAISIHANSTRRALKALCATVAIILPAYVLAQNYLLDFFASSESRYIQSIGKTEDAIRLLQSGAASDSDALRIAYFEYMIVRAADLILPHGLGYRSNGETFDSWFYDYGHSNTIDSAFLFIGYHYGYVVLLPLVAWLAIKSLAVARQRGRVTTLLLFLILCVPGLFDGGNLTVLQRAFWMGAYCAILITPSRRYLPKLAVAPSK